MKQYEHGEEHIAKVEEYHNSVMAEWLLNMNSIM
jgi:hypothetical protein